MPVRVTDSTRIGMFFKCNQSRQWYTEYEGRGLVAIEEREDTAVGLAFHEGIESLLLGDSIGAAFDKYVRTLGQIDRTTLDGYSATTEWLWHGYGVLSQFAKTLLPHFREKYNIVAIEQEMVVKLLPELWYLTRPDLMVEYKGEKGETTPLNINIKTTHYTDNILRNLEYSAQIAMEAKASAAFHGREYSGTLLLVVDKGKKGGPLKQDGDKTGTRLTSPFCYVWSNPKDGTWGFDWKRGLVKIPAWTVCSCPQDLLNKMDGVVNVSQFTYLLGPVTSAHANGIEDEIIQVESLVKAGLACRNRDACNNFGGYNKPCQYKALCWEGNKLHLYEPREFNHPIEETIYNERANANNTESGGTGKGEGQKVRRSEIQL